MKQTGTVLVADDDPQALSLLTELLQQEGYRVQPADSGKLVLISVAAQPPDLILLDVRMPGMDGFEVCRQLKANGTLSRPPVIFVSAFVDRQEWVKGLSLGAVDFVSKPFQREELLARVKTHIDLAALRAGLEMLVAQRTAELNYAIEQMRLEIAERRRVEQALRESEERFRQIANVAPIIIWTSDAGHSVTFRNEYAARFTGCALDQLTGDWSGLVHAEDRGRQQTAFAQAIAERARFQCEYRLRQADGQYCEMLDIGIPRFLADGEFAGFIGIILDLTDIKTGQERAQREKNLENLRMLSAGIAHDFNSLIGAIFGEVDLALSDVPPETPAHASLENIDRVAKRAAEIVRLLLAYVGDPSDQATWATVDLNVVVQEIVPYLKGPTFRKATIQTSLTPKLPTVWANLQQLRLVLLHLIINAVEALQGKPGLVTIGTTLVGARETRSFWEGRPPLEGDWVKLQIADNGSGMTDEVRARMFDPYYTTKLPGRGLGLSAIQGIIRSHRGNIKVRSAPGNGSIFEVLLPAENARLAASHEIPDHNPAD